MATTYQLIASQTVSAGGASSIDFTNIPQTFTDLIIKVSARGTNASIVCNIKWLYNGSTSGYSAKELYGDGASVGTGSGGTTSSVIQMGYANGSNATANTFGSSEAYIPNYAGSNYKAMSVDGTMETNASSSYVDMGATLWSNTSAITAINIAPTSGSWVQYSTFYLYGIKNA